LWHEIAKYAQNKNNNNKIRIKEKNTASFSSYPYMPVLSSHMWKNLKLWNGSQIS
jgi:hypothetical protein